MSNKSEHGSVSVLLYLLSIGFFAVSACFRVKSEKVARTSPPCVVRRARSTQRVACVKIAVPAPCSTRAPGSDGTQKIQSDCTTARATGARHGRRIRVRISQRQDSLSTVRQV